MNKSLLHPTLTDPRTGAPLCAIGIGRRGPIWPVMGASESPTPTDPANPPTDPADPPAADPAKLAGPPADPAKPMAGQEVKDLPDWAQKIINDARKDAGDARVAGKTAAERAQQELTDKLAVALGLKPDAATDPAELTKQVSAAQAAAKDSAVQLAVYRTAGKHQADPDALLDSSAFLRTLADIDHMASDFGAKIDAAIKTAVANNTKLKAVQAAPVSGAPHAGGPGGEQRPASLGQAIANHYKAQ